MGIIKNRPQNFTRLLVGTVLLISGIHHVWFASVWIAQHAVTNPIDMDNVIAMAVRRCEDWVGPELRTAGNANDTTWLNSSFEDSESSDVHDRCRMAIRDMIELTGEYAILTTSKIVAKALLGTGSILIVVLMVLGRRRILRWFEVFMILGLIQSGVNIVESWQLLVIQIDVYMKHWPQLADSFTWDSLYRMGFYMQVFVSLFLAIVYLWVLATARILFPSSSQAERLPDVSRGEDSKQV